MCKPDSTETWKPVIGYEGWYSVSNLGSVMRVMPGPGARPGLILRPQPVAHGYLAVRLSPGTKAAQRSIMVHRLVAAAFLGPCPIGRQVNHKNGIKADNKVTNLEYVTPKQNLLHARLVLGRPVMVATLPGLRGEDHPRAKLTDCAVQNLRRRYCRGVVTYKILASEYGVTVMAVKHAIDGKTWSHVN